MTLMQILFTMLLAMVISAGGTWQVQDWRYGKQLAEIGEAQAFAITEGWRRGSTMKNSAASRQ